MESIEECSFSASPVMKENPFDFDFVPPPDFDKMVQLAVEGIKDDSNHVVLCVGSAGVGKSRVGIEVVKAAAKQIGNSAIGSYVSMMDIVQFAGISDQPLLVLGLALVASFLPRAWASSYSNSIQEIAKKLQQDLQVSKVFLHVDDYTLNPLLLKTLLSACYLVNFSKIYNIQVVIVVTGTVNNKSMMDISVPGYNICKFIINPFMDEERIQALTVSFCKSVKTSTEQLKKFIRLQQLVTDCRGHPLLLRSLANSIDYNKYGEDLNERHLYNSGYYNRLLWTLSQYLGCEWAWIFGATSEYPKIARKASEGFVHVKYPVDENEKLGWNCLNRLVLFAFTATLVRKSETIHAQGEISYQDLEKYGLISLKHVKADLFQIIIPIMILGALNKLVHSFTGDDRLINPFELNPEIHRKLAMHSIQIRLTSFREQNKATCTLGEIRPNALCLGDLSEILVDIPEICNVKTLGRYFEFKLPLRTESDASGPPPSNMPGTLLVAARDQKALDGAVLLSGSKNGENIWIVILSQSKWSTSSYSGESDPPLMKIDIMKSILSLDGMTDYVLKSWLSEIQPQRNILFIYDIFSDRSISSKLISGDIKIPKSSKCAGLMITTEESFVGCVGPVLGARLQWKRKTQAL